MVELVPHYNPVMIVLSTGIAFIGAFAAVSLCEQYRLARLSPSATNRVALMIFVALSLGGVGIWAMHYIAVASFSLHLDGVKIPIRYNYTYIFVSLVVVILMEFLGLYCASTDNCFNKSKAQIMEMFIQRASNKFTLTEIKQMGKMRILRIVVTHSLHRIVLGGFVGGGGVALMHYLGMMSMEFQGTITHDPGLVVLSVLVAIGAVTGGFWIFFRILSIFPSLDILRVACALNGMFSLSGVHFIGLASARFEYDPNVPPPDPHTTIDSECLLAGTLAASVAFCAIMQVYVLSDLRGWLLRTSAQLRLADSVIVQLHTQKQKVTNSYRGSRNGSQDGSNPVGSPMGSSYSPRSMPRVLMKYLSRYGSMGSTPTGGKGSRVHPGGAAHGGIQSSSGSGTKLSTVALYNDYADEDYPSSQDLEALESAQASVADATGAAADGSELDQSAKTLVTAKPSNAADVPVLPATLHVPSYDGRVATFSCSPLSKDIESG
jgi:NO-binding membrane sensor protein with MHYT domain